MSTLFFGDRQIGDDGRTAALDDAQHSSWAEERHQQQKRANEATRRILEDIKAQMAKAATSSVVSVVELRARRIERDPGLLWTIGLSPNLSPTALYARADAMLEQLQKGDLRRWIGWGGESPDITLAAVKRYAERQMAAQQAAE